MARPLLPLQKYHAVGKFARLDRRLQSIKTDYRVNIEQIVTCLALGGIVGSAPKDAGYE